MTLMLFATTSSQVARNIKVLLEDFRSCYGLGVNCEKSRVFFSNCDCEVSRNSNLNKIKASADKIGDPKDSILKITVVKCFSLLTL